MRAMPGALWGSIHGAFVGGCHKVAGSWEVGLGKLQGSFGTFRVVTR